MWCVIFLWLISGSLFVRAEDWETYWTNGTVHNNTLEIQDETNPYAQPQILLLFSLGEAKNGSQTYSVPLTFNLTFTTSTNSIEIAFVKQISKAGTFQTSIPPCILDLDGKENFSLSASSSNPSISYNVLKMSFTFLESKLDGTFLSDYPMCPGVRYLYVQMPDDGFAYSLELKSPTNEISDIFNKLYLQHETCPDPLNGKWEFYANVTDLTSRNGFTFLNLQKPGKWWIGLQCNETEINSDWTISAVLTSTCHLGCFANGKCKIEGEPSPTCVCDNFHVGDECSQLFSGDYVLIIVAIFLLVALICYSIYKIVVCATNSRKQLQSEETDIDPLLSPDKHVRINATLE